MSTTIKSATTERSLQVIAVAGVGLSLGHLSESGVTTSAIYVNQADLLAALRAEGVLEDDGLKGRVEKLLEVIRSRPAYGAVAQDLYNALHPAPSFQFPTGLGAVVEGEFRGDSKSYKLVLCEREDEPWRATGNWYSEDEARTHFTNLRTLSEGVEL